MDGEAVGERPGDVGEGVGDEAVCGKEGPGEREEKK